MRPRYRTHLQLNACASHSTQRKSLHHEFHSLSPTTCMVRKAKQLLLAGGWHWLAGPGCPLRVMSGYRQVPAMSVLPLKADIRQCEWHVRYVP
jgi:hypothetical protein